MNPSGDVVIVTGAARGLGRAIAGGFAGAGAAVAMVDVLAEGVEQAAREVGTTGRATVPISCDITDVGQVEAMVQRVVDELGPPVVLVNSAGSLSALGPVWEVEPGRWCRDVNVNLVGTFQVTRAVLRAMMPRGGGYVINLVGAGVDAPHLYTTAYDSSKAGVVRLTEAVAMEAGEHGIKAFALFPGTVRTPMTQFIIESPEGRRWRPRFKAIFSEGRDRPVGLAVRWCLAIAAGRLDALSGRWLDATADLEQTIEGAEETVQRGCRVLRLR